MYFSYPISNNLVSARSFRGRQVGLDFMLYQWAYNRDKHIYCFSSELHAATAFMVCSTLYGGFL